MILPISTTEIKSVLHNVKCIKILSNDGIETDLLKNAGGELHKGLNNNGLIIY